MKKLIILPILFILSCSTEPEDACGVAGGDGSSCADCAGVPNGSSYEDECGDCDTDLTNDCVQDCAGAWGGTAIIDVCEHCNGGIVEVSNCVECPDSNPADCNGVCGGGALLDDCAIPICSGGTTGLIANVSCSDCAGVPNGHSDNGVCLGVCLGDTETDTNGFTCSNCIDGGFGSDCLGECGGLSVVDECSFCNDPLCSDSGIQSPFTVDYNPCDEGFFPTNSLWNSSCADCLGTINGTAYENLLTEECETILSTNGTIPIQFAISKIYPNPFNPVVTIAYSTPTSQYIEGHIYNLSGARISTVVSQYHSAGNYFIKWNATGKPSGIYIFILKTESEVKSQKLLLLK